MEWSRVLQINRDCGIPWPFDMKPSRCYTWFNYSWAEDSELDLTEYNFLFVKLNRPGSLILSMEHFLQPGIIFFPFLHIFEFRSRKQGGGIGGGEGRGNSTNKQNKTIPKPQPTNQPKHTDCRSSCYCASVNCSLPVLVALQDAGLLTMLLLETSPHLSSVLSLTG